MTRKYTPWYEVPGVSAPISKKRKKIRKTCNVCGVQLTKIQGVWVDSELRLHNTRSHKEKT